MSKHLLTSFRKSSILLYQLVPTNSKELTIYQDGFIVANTTWKWWKPFSVILSSHDNQEVLTITKKLSGKTVIYWKGTPLGYILRDGFLLDLNLRDDLGNPFRITFIELDSAKLKFKGLLNGNCQFIEMESSSVGFKTPYEITIEDPTLVEFPLSELTGLVGYCAYNCLYGYRTSWEDEPRYFWPDT